MTYNGKRFDAPYTIYRGMLNDIDFTGTLTAFGHVDLYEAVRSSGLRLPSYSQKVVERSLGVERILPEESGARYCTAFEEFIKTGNLRALIYNIEDTIGCLRILRRLMRLNPSTAVSR